MANRDVNIRIRGKDDTKGAFGSVTRGLNRLKGVVFSLQGALGGIAVGATVRKSLDLFAKQEQAESGVAKALELRGELSEQNLELLKQEASAIQSITTLGDEASLAIMRNGLNMGLAVSKADDLAIASANLAAALGKDVNSAAQQITKTLGGYAGELGEVLPEVKNLTQEQLKNGKVIDLINEKYKGFAEQQRETFGGKMEALNNAVGDSFEKLGETIVKQLGEGGSVIDFLRRKVEEVGFVLDQINRATGGGAGGAGNGDSPTEAAKNPTIFGIKLSSSIGEAIANVQDESLQKDIEENNRVLAEFIRKDREARASDKIPASPNLINLPDGVTKGKNFDAVVDAVDREREFHGVLERYMKRNGQQLLDAAVAAARSVVDGVSDAAQAAADKVREEMARRAERLAARRWFDGISEAQKNRIINADAGVLSAIADERMRDRIGVSGVSSGGQTNSLTGVAERSRDMAARAVQEAKAQRDKIIEELKNITRNTNNLGAADAVTVLEPFA